MKFFPEIYDYICLPIDGAQFLEKMDAERFEKGRRYRVLTKNQNRHTARLTFEVDPDHLQRGVLHCSEAAYITKNV